MKATEATVKRISQTSKWRHWRGGLKREFSYVSLVNCLSLYLCKSTTWGRAVPHSRRGAAAPPPKNCLANIEYGDIGSVLTRARSDLNNNPNYLALSLQHPISEAVLRDKYNEQLKIARRLRDAAPDKAVFEQDESHPRVLKLAIKINKQILSGEERRAGNNYCETPCEFILLRND
jgi:hypothetical protein